jgi:hypothetical protein
MIIFLLWFYVGWAALAMVAGWSFGHFGAQLKEFLQSFSLGECYTNGVVFEAAIDVDAIKESRSVSFGVSWASRKFFGILSGA